MKLFGNRKHRKNQTPPTVPTQTKPVTTGEDLSATAILDEVQLEIQAMDQAGTFKTTAKPAAPQAAPEEPQKPANWWRRRTGLQRGLIILALALVVLGGTVFAVWRAVVKPPEGTTIDKTSAEEIIRAVEAEEEQQQGGLAVIDAGEEPQPEGIYTEAKDTEPVEPDTEETYIPTVRLEGTYNILLCGTDGDDGRTDTIMLASFNVTDNQLNVLSIPRDTMYLSGSRVAKINSAYGTGGRGVDGVEYLAAKLTTMLGVPIDAYMLVDLQAFVDVIDLIGGVWFDVPQNMNYEDPYQDLYIHLTAGYQHLDGEKCMQLVRFRSYPQADLQRVSVQQDFLKAVMEQCLSIANISKVKEFSNILSENMTTNLPLGSMIDLGMQLLSIDLDEVVFCTLPGEGYTYSDGGSYYVLYRTNALDMLNEYFNPYDRDLTSSDVSMVYKSGNTIIMPSGRTYSAGSGSSSGTTSSNTTTNTNTNTTTTPHTTQTAPEEEPQQTETPVEHETEGTETEAVPTDTEQQEPSEEPEALFDGEDTEPEETTSPTESTAPTTEEPSDPQAEEPTAEPESAPAEEPAPTEEPAPSEPAPEETAPEEEPSMTVDFE